MSNSVYVIERVSHLKPNANSDWATLPDGQPLNKLIGYTKSLQDAYLVLDSIQDELDHTDWFVDGGFVVDADLVAFPRHLVVHLNKKRHSKDTWFTVEVSEVKELSVNEHP